MNAYIKLLISVIVLTAFFPIHTLAQEKTKKDTRQLIYTFIGPVFGAGFNQIKQNDWFKIRQKTVIFSGEYLAGGFTLNIYSQYLAGDFAISYMYNSQSKPLQHLFYSISGRYIFTITNIFLITPGIGLYFETKPSNREYNGGAGFQVPIGFVLNTSFDTKLFLDVITRYGYYGMGENSKKFSYGLNLGFVFKVGRI